MHVLHRWVTPQFDGRYQSDHPEIIAKAKRIVAGERNPVRVNQAICMWVFDNLKKERIPGFPNAVGTLRKGSGDCARHTALFVALCRAARATGKRCYRIGISPEVWWVRGTCVGGSFCGSSVGNGMGLSNRARCACRLGQP